MRQGHCGENMDAIKPVSTMSFSTFEPSASENVCKMRAIFFANMCKMCANLCQICANKNGQMFPITHHSPDKRGNLRGSIPKVMWGYQKCDFLPIIGAVKKSKKFNYILAVMN